MSIASVCMCQFAQNIIHIPERFLLLIKSYVATNPSRVKESSDLKWIVNDRDVLKMIGGVLIPQYFPMGCALLSLVMILSKISRKSKRHSELASKSNEMNLSWTREPGGATINHLQSARFWYPFGPDDDEIVIFGLVSKPPQSENKIFSFEILFSGLEDQRIYK